MGIKRFERLRNYDMRQFSDPLYSTVEYEKFLNKHSCFQGRIMDLGSGFGSVTNYFAKKHADVNFIGADYNEYSVEVARTTDFNKGLSNLSFEPADWLGLPEKFCGQIDGIYSVHSLCCFKRIEPAIEALMKIDAKWVSFNSLFYEGPLDVMIHIRDHSDKTVDDNSPDADFNTFSLEKTRETFAKYGYTEFFFEPFNIPVALPRPANGARGTYTMSTEIGPRTQFSGPVHLPWNFVLAKKNS